MAQRKGLGSVRGRLASAGGVCLTELMLSVTTGAIVLAASLDTFNIVHRQTVVRQQTVAHQQDLRLGLEVFEQEARQATADSIVTASADKFLFNANINAQYTTTTATVMPGQFVLSVEDGSGWGAGKNVMLCSGTACEPHQLSRSGQRYQLSLHEAVGQLFPSGTSIEVMNRVAYYTKRDERSDRVTLMRMVDGGASALMGGLDIVEFQYCDDLGASMSILGRMKRVILKVKSSHSSLPVIKEVSLRS